MKKIILLVLSFILFQSTIFAQEIQTTSFNKSIAKFKVETDQKLSIIRDELASKRYPQAHFIKSIQFQLNDLQFTTIQDFKAAEDILNNLVKGISSQSMIYKDNKRILVDNERVPLLSLKKLKNDFIKNRQQRTEAKNNNLTTEPALFSLASFTSFWSLGQKSPLYRPFIIFTVVIALISFVFKSETNKIPKVKVKGKDTSPPQKSEALNPPTRMLGDLLIPVCEINSKGFIVYENNSFVRAFGRQKEWNAFLDQNFKVDNEFKGNPQAYKYLRNQNHNYFITLSSHNSIGTKFAIMQKFERAQVTQTTQPKVQNRPKAVLENYSTLDLLENSFARMNSFRTGATITVDEKNLNEKVTLKLNKEITQRFFDHYSRILAEVAKLKSSKEEILVTYSRDEGFFVISALIPNATLIKEDLTKTILSGGKKSNLQDGLNEFNQLLGGVKSKVSLKNIIKPNFKGLSIQVRINDEVRVTQVTNNLASV